MGSGESIEIWDPRRHEARIAHVFGSSSYHSSTPSGHHERQSPSPETFIRLDRGKLERLYRRAIAAENNEMKNSRRCKHLLKQSVMAEEQILDLEKENKELRERLADREDEVRDLEEMTQRREKRLRDRRELVCAQERDLDDLEHDIRRRDHEIEELRKQLHEVLPKVRQKVLRPSKKKAGHIPYLKHSKRSVPSEAGSSDSDSASDMSDDERSRGRRPIHDSGYSSSQSVDMSERDRRDRSKEGAGHTPYLKHSERLDLKPEDSDGERFRGRKPFHDSGYSSPRNTRDSSVSVHHRNRMEHVSERQ